MNDLTKLERALLVLLRRQDLVGRTLFVGLRGGVVRTGVAAGLGEQKQLAFFQDMLRYLVSRDGLDCYIVAVPVYNGGDEAILVEIATAADCRQAVHGLRELREGTEIRLRFEPVNTDQAIFEQLFLANNHLPGRMRRDLDQLAEALRLDLAGCYEDEP